MVILSILLPPMKPQKKKKNNLCPGHPNRRIHPILHSLIHSFLFLRILLFFKIFYFSATLSLLCCTPASSGFREQGRLFIAVCRLCGRSSCCRARAVGHVGSVVAVHGLCCSTACGIFPDQGLNPCTLHYKADS